MNTLPEDIANKINEDFASPADRQLVATQLLSYHFCDNSALIMDGFYRHGIFQRLKFIPQTGENTLPL